MSFEEYLTLGAGGGCLLFCGAGFSADCLNFSEKEIGASSPLLEALNKILNYNYTNIQLAADDYLKEYGEHKLYSLLKERYSVATRKTEIDEILRYPWSRIYTTNYDDVISQSLTSLKTPHYVVNNLVKPADAEKMSPEDKLVVHLHGSLRSWDINNFSSSCVLGRESYLKISRNSNWAPELREDYAKAIAVFFVGFSNNDFYLAQELFSATASREKVFFINKKTSVNDRELIGQQRDFGYSVAIGKTQFSEIIAKILKTSKIDKFVPRSFRKLQLPKAASERASVQQQEQFIIYGQQEESLLFRDMLEESQSYRLRRDCVTEVRDFLQSNGRIALIVGGICSGKTQIFDEATFELAASGRQVFRLDSKYHGLSDEARRIMNENSGVILAIDDCFSLLEEFREIVKFADSVDSYLLLTSRSLAYDSEADLRDIISDSEKFKVFDTEILNSNEIDGIIDCTDRISGWGKDASSHVQKQKIISNYSNGRLSGFLLNRFKSKHIRDRFISELDIFRTAGSIAVEALILAMYLRQIGERVQENLLSEMLGIDALGVLRPHLEKTPFISFDPPTNSFKLIASVNARDVLMQMFDPRDVTSSVIEALKRIAPIRNQYPYKHIFTQLLRYTRLKQVIQDQSEQDFFFDRLSELNFCRSHVLFWLQWSMCMRENQDFLRARQYLDEAYGISMNWRNFDNYHLEDQLDDQKAKLLLDSSEIADSSANYLRTANEVYNLLVRLINRPEQTSHPYLTIQFFDAFMEKASPKLITPHKEIIVKIAKNLGDNVKKKIDEQHEGYIKKSMHKAKTTLDKIVNLA